MDKTRQVIAEGEGFSDSQENRHSYRPEGCYTQNGFLYITVDPANIGNGVDSDCRCPICKDDPTYRTEM